MWKELRKDDLQSSYLHDRICTQNDLPCVQIFKETRHKYLLRWDYNTFNDRGWERAKFLNENHFWRICTVPFVLVIRRKKQCFLATFYQELFTDYHWKVHEWLQIGYIGF